MIWIVNPYGFMRIDLTNCHFMDYIKKRKRRDPRRKEEKVKLEFLKYGLSIRMGMGSYGLTIRIVNS